MASWSTLHPKVVGGSVAGLVAYAIISLLGRWVVITPELASGITIAVASVGGWLTPLVKSAEAKVQSTVSFTPCTCPATAATNVVQFPHVQTPPPEVV